MAAAEHILPSATRQWSFQYNQGFASHLLVEEGLSRIFLSKQLLTVSPQKVVHEGVTVSLSGMLATKQGQAVAIGDRRKLSLMGWEGWSSVPELDSSTAAACPHQPAPHGPGPAPQIPERTSNTEHQRSPKSP